MTERRRTLNTTVAWLAVVSVAVAGEVLYGLNQFGGEGAAFVESWFLLLSSLAVSTIGVLILRRMPEHVIGRLLYAIGLLLAVSSLLDEYAIYALVTEPDSLPFGREAAAAEVIGGTAFGLTAVFLFLLFPDGHLPAAPWRPVVFLGSVAIAGLTVGGLLRPGDLGGAFEGIDNPFGVAGTEDVFAALSVGSLLLVSACGLAGLASLVVRFREADGTERRQLEWLFLGGVCLALALGIGAPLRASGVLQPSAQSILFSLGFTAIPLAMGVAILRYRLYDIDWIINRTLVYVPLTAILAGLYVAMTGLLRTLLTELTDWGSDAAIALSTLMVAGALTPLKNYLQAFVDAHFKETHDPTRQAKRLATQARSVIEVLQGEAFLRKYLRELIAAFDSRGGLIRVGYSTYAEGHWQSDDSLVVNLISEDISLGHVSLASRFSGAPFTAEDRERLQEMSQVVVELAWLQQSTLRLTSVRRESNGVSEMNLRPGAEESGSVT